jgi:membrane protease YdiL (CAAX protease family)
MTTDIKIPSHASIASRGWVTLGLILLMFVLRYLVTASRMFFNDATWVSPVFEVGTYLLVAILLIWENQSLQDYHINNLAIRMIILFKPIETIYLSLLFPDLNSPLAIPKLPGLFIWIIALGLLIFFRKRLFTKEAVKWPDWKWLLIGGLVGLATALVTAYPMSLQVTKIDPQNSLPIFYILGEALLMVPYQIGYAAISEEPVFRGFLWGYLHKSGWRDVYIWLFQAILFTLGHLYYFNTLPISFWLIVPLGALVMGWLAWRSRSIATSMAAHGVMNGFGYSLGLIISYSRL